MRSPSLKNRPVRLHSNRGLRSVPLICAAPIMAFLTSPVVKAQTITKANNVDNLDQGTSWVSGSVPTITDVALWDSTVTGANTTFLGSNLSWRGLRITNPGGPVTIDLGSTLTLGSGGIDMSSATQNLTINANLTVGDRQLWSIGAGRNLNVGGTLTKSAGAALKISLADATSSITLAGAVDSLITQGSAPFVILNGTDFGARNGTNTVVGGATITGINAYLQNPASATPSISGTINTVVDVVNDTGGSYGVRLGNNTTAWGFRFNAPHSTNDKWEVRHDSSRVLTTSSILVTANVGTDNVEFTASGSLRISNTGTNEMLVYQDNPTGNLIFSQTGGLNQQTAGASFTKLGSGKVILNTNASYTGVTRIREGAFQIGNGGTTGVLGGSSSVINDATLVFNRSDAVTFGTLITGSGQVSQEGVGTVTLTGTNSYTGATNLNAGAIEFTTLGNLGSGTTLNFNGGALRYAAGNTEDASTRTITLNSGGGTIDTNGNNVTFANPIGNSGVGGLTKIGAGTLSLGASNSYSGNTVVNGGTLSVTNKTGSATGSGSVTVNVGASLAGTGFITGPVAVASGGILSPGVGVGTITLGSVSLSTGSILNFDFAAASNDSVVVTSPGGLTINGGGFNLYSAGTSASWSTPGTYNLFSLNGGIQGAGLNALSVLNPAAGFNYTFGSTSNLLTLTVAAAGVISDWKTDGGGSWGNAANWTNGVPNQVNATATFGGAITQPRTITLDGNKTVGAISFENTNSYTIAQGTGGSLTVERTSGAAQNVVVKGSHTISAPVILASDLNADISDGGTLTVAGAVSGAKGITKTGLGILALSGTNSFSGDTQINNGTVEFARVESFGAGNIGLSGGRLRWASGNTADISSRTVTFGSGGAIFDTNGNDVTLAGGIGNAGTGSFTKAGSGTMTLQGINTYTGPTRITGGTLSISNNSNLGDELVGAGLTLDGGTLAATFPFSLDYFGLAPRAVTVGSAGGGIDVAEFSTLTIPGAMSGSGPLVKSGPGTLMLSGTNGLTLSSPVTINGGTVVLATPDNSQQGLGTGAVTFAGGALTLAGSTGNASTQYGTFGNPLNIPAGQTGTVNMTQRGGLTSTLTGAGTFNLNVNYVRGDVSANWSGFTGQINVNTTAGGIDDFRIAGFVALNIPQARLNLGDGVFMYQTFNPPTGTGTQTVHNIGELSGSSGAVIAGNPVAGRFANWTVGALNTDSSFAGTIQDSTGAGASRLTKVGIGTLTLSGFNTYTGQTDVNGGTLLVSGSLSGTTGVTVGLGSTLKFGASDAVNDLAALTLNGGTLDTTGFSDVLGVLAVGIDGIIDLGAGASVLHFADSSAQFWTGTLAITNWSGSPGGGGSDQLFFGNASNALMADQLSFIQFVNPAGFAPGSYGARILENGEIVAVPEPSAAMFLLGGAALLARRRRQHA